MTQLKEKGRKLDQSMRERDFAISHEEIKDCSLMLMWVFQEKRKKRERVKVSVDTTLYHPLSSWRMDRMRMIVFSSQI